MRYAARIDANKEQVVSALRAAGAYVWDLKLPVDLLVGYAGHTYLMEIKRDGKAKFTPLQRDFFEAWAGGTLCRVDSPESALRMIGVVK
jgi:hypothetical protein